MAFLYKEWKRQVVCKLSFLPNVCTLDDLNKKDISISLNKDILEQGKRGGGYIEMSSILAAQMRGGGGVACVSANEYSCTQEPK
jgi:hypothetical protein